MFKGGVAGNFGLDLSRILGVAPDASSEEIKLQSLDLGGKMVGRHGAGTKQCGFFCGFNVVQPYLTYKCGFNLY